MVYPLASQRSKIQASQHELEDFNGAKKYVFWSLLFAAQVASVSCSSAAAYLESFEHVSPIQVLNTRMLITIGLCFFWDWQSKSTTQAWDASDSTAIRRLLVIRCVAGTVSAISFYYALLHIELPQVITVYLLGPLIAYLLASIVKGVEVKALNCLRVAMAMAGAGLIVQQTFVTQSHDSPESGAHTRLLGFSIAIAGAMANGIVFVSLQAMGPSIELRYQVKWFAIFVANITSIMPFATSNPSFRIRADLNPKAWFLNFSIGLLGFLMEVFTAGGFKGNNCVDAAQMTYIQPLLALVLEWVLRGNRPTSLALFGSTIVLGSVTIVLISAVHKPKRITVDCDEESNRLLVSTEIYG